MIYALLCVVLLVGVATLTVALRIMWSSRRSEGLAQERTELLRDQHERLEFWRDERRMLTEELERESQERRKLVETLEATSPQLIENLERERQRNMEAARLAE
jgi:hypothetical protein